MSSTHRPPASKYRAHRVEVDGIRFASKMEARRYTELKLMQQAGAIADLRLQVRYPLTVNGQTVCTYVADFVYFDTFRNALVTEDVKGALTQVYRIKKKLMKAVHNIDILETTA